MDFVEELKALEAFAKQNGFTETLPFLKSTLEKVTKHDALHEKVKPWGFVKCKHGHVYKINVVKGQWVAGGWLSVHCKNGTRYYKKADDVIEATEEEFNQPHNEETCCIKKVCNEFKPREN